MMEETYDDSTTKPSAPVNVTGLTVASLFVPGLGQLILGQVGKALSFFALGLVLFLIWPPLLILIDLYSAWDAYKESKSVNADMDKNLEATVQIAEGQIAAESMVSQITKLNLLGTEGVLTPEELTDQKAKVIGLLETKKPVGSAEDFLVAFIPLVKSDGLTSDELSRVKALLLQQS